MEPSSSIHDAIKVINESELNDQNKHKCRHFLKRNNNEIPFIIDAKNRSVNSSDPSQLTIFLEEMAKQQDKLDEQEQQRQQQPYQLQQPQDQQDTPDGSQQQQQPYQHPYQQSRTPRQGDQRYQQQQQQQPDRNNYDNREYNENEEVNIFKNDNDVNPTMTFDPYSDWNSVKTNLNLHSGWLKRKGDTTNRRVRIGPNGIGPGDYTLLDAIPETKKVRILFTSPIHSYWSSDQRVTINYNDTNDDIRRKIQSAFKFDRHHFSIYQLVEADSNKRYHNLDFNDLDESKTYELIIPWLSKIQKKKEDQLASKNNNKSVGGSGGSGINNNNTNTTSDYNNAANTSSSDSSKDRDTSKSGGSSKRSCKIV